MRKYLVGRHLRNHHEWHRANTDSERPAQISVSLTDASNSYQYDTHATKVMMAVLASRTAPLSRPKPTATNDTMAPVAESDRSFLRPRRCEHTMYE